MMRRSLGLLVCIAVVSSAGAADPPSAGGRPLSAAEEKWLKEVKDFLKTPAEKKEFEDEFRADTHTGRKGIYDFFRKTLAAKEKARAKRGREDDLDGDAIEMVPLPGGGKTGDGVQRKPLTDPHAGKRGGPLTGEEARWLKQIVDWERDPAEKAVIASEFKEEGPVGRKAMHDLYLKMKRSGGKAPWKKEASGGKVLEGAGKVRGKVIE